jgi:hypothetical protein
MRKKDWLEAAKSGELTILQRLREKHCTRDRNDIYEASLRGHSEVTKWLHMIGVRLTRKVFSNIVAQGDFEMVEWLYLHNCPWNSDVVFSAFITKNYSIGKWLIQHGCPINTKTINIVVQRGQYELIEWMIDHGDNTLCNEEACLIAATKNDLRMLKLLYTLNFPLSEEPLHIKKVVPYIKKWIKVHLISAPAIFPFEL